MDFSCFFKLQKKQNNFAFTIAEILIVIGIIGIIAMMTLPSLFSEFQNAQHVSAAKENYSILIQALEKYKYDYSGDFNALFPPEQNANPSIDILSGYLNITKKCKTSDICWTEKTRLLNAYNDGKGVFSSGGSTYGRGQAAAFLANGARITVLNNNFAARKGVPIRCNYKRDANGNYIEPLEPVLCIFNHYGQIILDTNGARGPNRFGYDTWEYRIYENKIGLCDWRDYYGCLDTILLKGKIVDTKILDHVENKT